ncbi:MAG: hypothetical protein A2869_00315 [Candidatus Levybacteria bacterium RIFCSPHIGHO2_01_FULL_40_58]|nr:MAG: hypothetical protein A2869_00315 [Candidatus Levybacteria bacterium RIFCSPHIGHO2_01_FULL_40_58]OGH40081.1 MAG: hypothetical protein A2894_04055 [Candidatus Levybacteria bacterium RIFCSPLOWO2_01_FULL_40_64]
MEYKIKPIKTEEDYKRALKWVEDLMDKDPNPDSEEGEKLELLATLIKEYEANAFPDTLPDPVEAILFRMEQQGLKPADLAHYLGSSSRVSEVLSRKRSLTLDMMRKLEAGLGIPAKVLLKKSDDFEDASSWSNYPLREMAKRGYFEDKNIKEYTSKQLIEDFFSPVGAPTAFVGMLRKTYYRSKKPVDKYALAIWSAYIVKKANKIKYPTKFDKSSLTPQFMERMVKLSVEPNGVLLARDLLIKTGIGFVVEPHFQNTYLDAITIMTNKDHPIIGMTLRQDRLDNFWFTLMHELAHIALHFDSPIDLFYDDLDDKENLSSEEQAADGFARETLIPESKWVNSPAKLVPSPIAAQSLARELGVNPAIVAGRMRYENDKYPYLFALLGQGKVRPFFPEVNWKL